MGVLAIFHNSTLARYIHATRNTPRQLMCNWPLLFSAAMYAMCGVTLCWDQGSSSLVPSLPGFMETFHISSGANAKAIANFISVVYIGAGVGAFGSFFINDTIGRLWSMRLYMVIWIVGQIIATFSNGSLPVLYVARVIAGLGIGAHTVTGPLSLVEIAPAEIRGLITVWYSVVLLLSLFLSTICVYGISLHVAASKLQYQIVWFAPCIFLTFIIGLSFFAYESPRWLVRAGRKDEARRNLSALRGMSADSPRVKSEFDSIIAELEKERDRTGVHTNVISWDIVRLSFLETFTVKANIRRVVQTCVSFGLAQLSGANSVTSYFIPIMKLISDVGDSHHALFLSSMYSLAKFFFTLIASFFLIDALGRRGSLFTGITIQMISDVYIGVFLKFRAQDDVSPASGEAAIAMIFLHGFGYTIGLLVLPYVFSSEVWPNHLRSFGSSIAQTFHWLFYFGVSRGTPSILSSMDNWGAFIFFAGWCFVSLIYVFLMVPETAGYSLEELDRIFEGSWFMAFRSKESLQADVIEGQKADQSLETPKVSANTTTKKLYTEEIEPRRNSSLERGNLV